MVVDSLTLNNLPGVHVKIKNTNRTAVSDLNGIFVIQIESKDTLIFSSVGYSKTELPVNIEDEIMFVRMHEESIMLKEIVIRDRAYHLKYNYFKSPTLSSTKPLPAAGVNFGYFSKGEKEKRKLVAVMRDLERVRVYVEIVNDKGLREEIMEKYSISESRYYDLLAAFNQRNDELMHSANADLILSSLFFYFEHSSNK